MKLVIDIPEEQYELVRHGNKSYTTELKLMNAVANGTPLPENPTNGDIIKAMFPDALLTHEFDIDWWNAPYKRGEEK